MRGALLDLHICAASGSVNFEDVTNLSDRKRTETITNALQIIFKSSSVENSLGALNDVDMDPRDVIFWVDENLPKEYTNARSLSKAYEYLARADVFNGRIRRRQHWRFLAYINNLLTAGISSAKEEKNTTFFSYRQPMRFLRMWQANIKNAKKKEIAKKLAGITHVSHKVAMEQIPYLQTIFVNSKAENIIDELELTDEEVAWLSK